MQEDDQDFAHETIVIIISWPKQSQNHACILSQVYLLGSCALRMLLLLQSVLGLHTGRAVCKESFCFDQGIIYLIIV